MPVGESKYYNYLIGYNSRLDALQAAILRKKLSHLDEFIDGRRNNARLFNEAFRNTEYLTPIEGENACHSYYIYALKHDKADKIMEKLKESGVPCGTYYPVPLHLQGAFATLGYKKGDLPVTEELSQTTFAIPVFPEMYDEERNYIIEQVKKALED
jgi:dTDP-4-amino-4,6-dideoxygalactose transaminase